MARIVRIHEKGGPEVLKLEELDLPAPAAGEVAVAIKAFGLNRAEVMFRGEPYVEDPVFPARLGYEGAGIVTAIGPDVSNVKVGDIVSLIPPLSISEYGTYGDAALMPAELVVKHPASLSWEQAAAIWMQYITAYGALIEYAKLTKDDTVIVTAASSSVGISAIQIARAIGAKSIAVTRTSAKKEALLKIGADHVIVTNDEDLLARVNEITGGKGARVAFDPVAGEMISALARAMTPYGILLEYGALSSAPSQFPILELLSRNLTIHGWQYKEVIREPAQVERGVRFILDGMASGALQPVIDKVFKLEDIVEAHRYMESNQQFGKIVVSV